MYDHRKVGRELGLFDSDPLIGAGLPYWLPAGAAVRRALESYIAEVERRAGYQQVYSPVLAKTLMRRKLDAAFIRSEEHMEDLVYRRVRTDPLVFVFPSDHRLASHEAVAPQEIAREAFLLPSKAAPAVRRVILAFFNRASIDLKPEHEVHNVVHAISMITSTRAVMLLPAYTKRYLPESIATRPVKGEVPTLDLVLAYHKANKSPILKLLLSRVGKLAEAS